MGVPDFWLMHRYEPNNAQPGPGVSIDGRLMTWFEAVAHSALSQTRTIRGED